MILIEDIRRMLEAGDMIKKILEVVSSHETTGK
jgi:hypothetical protein